MITGGTGFIVAAYIMAVIILGGYSINLVHRLRKEREMARENAARRASGAPPTD